MANYAVTFGQQYAKEPHPTAPGAHPDGFYEVLGAIDEAEARDWVVREIGTSWSFIYDMATADWVSYQGHYPRGCLGQIRRNGLRTRDL